VTVRAVVRETGAERGTARGCAPRRPRAGPPRTRPRRGRYHL